MKISKFLAFSMMAATALTFGACSDDDDDKDDNQISFDDLDTEDCDEN